MSLTTKAIYHLYGAPYCHLCGDAKLILDEMTGMDYVACDISGDFELKKAYATRIPVLKNTVTGEELNWPFNASVVRQFIA